MSEDGDVDVESSEDVPEIGEEAIATTADNGILYGRVSVRKANLLYYHIFIIFIIIIIIIVIGNGECIASHECSFRLGLGGQHYPGIVWSVTASPSLGLYMVRHCITLRGIVHGPSLHHPP